jgi:sporadic carbohydrate cluster protein (TIGR04323 family)
MIKVRGYVFSRPFMGERVPQHVQNLVLRDYCERNRMQYLLSGTEYAMKGCHLILEQLLDELSDIEGIVAYSLFQLPEDTEQRKRVYYQMINSHKVMHFAVEGLQASTLQDWERIEILWRIRQTLPKCAQVYAWMRDNIKSC